MVIVFFSLGLSAGDSWSARCQWPSQVCRPAGDHGCNHWSKKSCAMHI